MPDYYEQPAYLKELLEEPKTETTTSTTFSSSTPDDTDAEKRSFPQIPQRYIIIAIALLVILVLAILLLSTRRSGTGTTTTTTGVDPNKTVILQWWGVFLSEDAVGPLLDEYNSINPNVTIEYADKWPLGAYDDAVENYRSELNRRIASTDVVETPDIFMVNNSWAKDYIDFSAAATSNVTDYNTFATTFYPVVASDYANATTQKVFGVPLWLDTYAILYNQDQLNAASVSSVPTDWTIFRNLARTLTQKTGSTLTRGGFAAGVASNVTYATAMFNLLMVQNGVEITDASGLPIFGSQTESKSALDFYKDFTNNTNYTWRSNAKTDAVAFLEGDVSMIFAPSYRYRDLKTTNEDLSLGLDIGVSQVPQLAGQSQPLINWADYWGNMVAAKRPNTAYAWDFLNWITQPEQLRKLDTNIKADTAQFGILYPRKDMASENLSDPDLKVFAESLPFAQSWQMVKGIEVNGIFEELLDLSSPTANNITQSQNDITPLVNSAGTLTQ